LVNIVLAITANAACQLQSDVPVNLDLDEGKQEILRSMPLSSCATTVEDLIVVVVTATLLQPYCGAFQKLESKH
jgi:hypothetical protein